MPLTQLTQNLNEMFGRGRADGGVRQLAAFNARCMKKARRLAATHDIDINPASGGGWWVTKDLNPDPLDGQQFAANGAEALTLVQVYVRHLTKGV